MLPEITLVWTDGMEAWQELGSIKELSSADKQPPPLPNISNPKTDHLDTKRNTLNQFKQLIMAIIVWCSFHLFALITSYAEIKPFNFYGTHKTEAFWPFVQYQFCEDKIIFNYMKDNKPREIKDILNDKGPPTVYAHKVGEDCYFNGIFSDYDWSEFSLYLGIGIAIIFLSKYKQNVN